MHLCLFLAMKTGCLARRVDVISKRKLSYRSNIMQVEFVLNKSGVEKLEFYIRRRFNYNEFRDGVPDLACWHKVARTLFDKKTWSVAYTFIDVDTESPFYKDLLSFAMSLLNSEFRLVVMQVVLGSYKDNPFSDNSNKDIEIY